MQAASLKEQFINVITFHHGRELWFTRPEQSYDDTVESFIDDLVKITQQHKEGVDFKMYQWDPEDSLSDNTDISHVIGRNIRDLQDSKGWSLKTLAKKSRLNEEYLRNVQRGESLLGMWALMQIAEALGVKSSELLPF